MESCELLPMNGSHLKIKLEDKIPLAIGRSPLTLITDRKCSKQQVEVCADYAKKEVQIKHLGFHPSRVATKVLQKGDSYILGPMGWFELIEGKFRYHVHFGKQLLDAEYGTSKNSLQKRDLEGSDSLSDIEPPQKKIKIASSSAQKTQDIELPINSASTQKTLLSFVEDSTSFKHHCEDLVAAWREEETLLILQYGPPSHSSKVAAFDLDNTIIETASGRKFPTGPADWKIMAGVNDKLSSLSKEGYKVVILSNQFGISKGKPTKVDFKKKMEAIAKKLHIPLLMLASIGKDINRKPCMGMWTHLEKVENGKIGIDMSSSFYVGDAAGRIDKWMPGKKKDFSCTDRKFAANLGLKFFTPEELFLNYPQCKKFDWGIFNPTTLRLDHTSQQLEQVISLSQEMVLFVGYPASGKSTYFRKHFEPSNYVHINRDKLGSWQKCVAKCTENVKAGKSVVIDNTNPDIESRKRYTNVAKQFHIPVRCFLFTTSLEHAKHNNRFRELTANYRDDVVKINDMVFNIYKSKYTEPLLNEGFAEIVRVEFVPFFTEKQSESLYYTFLE